MSMIGSLDGTLDQHLLNPESSRTLWQILADAQGTLPSALSVNELAAASVDMDHCLEQFCDHDWQQCEVG